VKPALLANTGRRAQRWPDRVIFGGLLFLIIFTPLALGSVRRPCFVLMEAAIFALVIVWMVKLWIGGPVRLNIEPGELRRLALPSAALGFFLLLQLAPMPARILRVISPRTFEIYLVSFPSWPALSPYQGFAGLWSGHGSRAGGHDGALPPAVSGPARAIRAAAGKDGRQSVVAALRPRGIDGMRWRTLSLSPSVSASALIEWTALGSLGFLILLYPFGLVGERDAENRLRLGIMLALIGAATAVALLGLAERTWWNGKILWFYVPRDWSGPLIASVTRASGPFVDPDHFANYLEMAMPLAIMGAIFGLPGASRRNSDIRLFCAVASCLLLAGIVLSLSRGGWAAMIAGVCAAILMGVTRAREQAPAFVRRIGIRALPLTIAAAALLIGLALFLIGPGGREQTSERIGATIVQADSLQYRPVVWRDTLSMIADFPVFGVGLGCWPDLFPHYQRPPWMPFFFREAENDYLQFGAETGLAGLGLLLWLAAVSARQLWSGARCLPRRRWPAFAGLTAGLGAAMLHEAVDFSLHTPANALLFTVVLALALRIALMDGREMAARPIRLTERGGKAAYLKAALAAGAAAALIMAALWQNGAVYPYGIDRPGSLARAEANLAGHPAVARAHFTLATLMPPGMRESAALRQRELAAAVWLDPNDPEARDFYARTLMVAGDKRGGLREISQSVYRAPVLGAHYYLEQGLIPWLLPEEQGAIASGFERAIKGRFPASADDLGNFYLTLGRYKDAAEVYAAAAASDSGGARMNYLLKAGEAYAELQDVATAAAMFEQAARIDPSDARPYAKLAGDIFEQAGDGAGARAAVNAGIRQGADPYTLEMALAGAAWRAGDMPTAENALGRAFKYDPTFEAASGLGEVYAAENRPERAVLAFQQAVEINSASAQAFFNLAQAQERDFEYFEAAKSYARAAALAPHDAGKRNAYLAFQRRTAESARHAADVDASAAAAQASAGASARTPAQDPSYDQ
jgi:tetratricopeptide (TPR) repeat protein